MTATIRTETLTKSYGRHRGVVGLDLEVQPGEIFGYLGPNGAGKTTTIRLLLDLIRPTSGRAFVFDIDTMSDPVAIHRRTGYLPGEFILYDRLTGGETISYFAHLRGNVEGAYQRRLVERLDLDPSRRYREAAGSALPLAHAPHRRATRRRLRLARHVAARCARPLRTARRCLGYAPAGSVDVAVGHRQ
jgi:ABC-type multidrug transport system ATPase subunit